MTADDAKKDIRYKTGAETEPVNTKCPEYSLLIVSKTD